MRESLPHEEDAFRAQYGSDLTAGVLSACRATSSIGSLNVSIYTICDTLALTNYKRFSDYIGDRLSEDYQ